MCAEPSAGYFTVGHKWYLECPSQPGAAIAVTVFLNILVIYVWLHIMRLAEGSIYDAFDVGVKFLHLIGFIAQFPLRWHPNLDSIVLVLLIANLEIDFIGPQCIWPSFNSATLFFFQLVVPFVIILFSTLFWLVGERYFPDSRVGLSVASEEPLLNKACIRDGTIRIENWKIYVTNKSIQVFGFMYQVLVYRTFTCFTCVKGPDGQSSFLKAAPDVDCGSSLHTGMVVTAVLYTIFILIGFPVYIFRVLYLGKVRNTLLSIEYMQAYGAFYQQWKMEYFWWEALILCRKFCIGLILAVVQVPMFQGALCVLLIYISILLHLSALPYAEERNNWLEITCLFCALTYVSCGMVFYPSLDQNQQCVGTGDSLSSFGAACNNNMQIKGVISLVLILMVTFTFLLAVAMTFWEVYERHLAKSASKYIWESKKWFGVKDKGEKVLQREAKTILDSMPHINLKRFSVVSTSWPGPLSSRKSTDQHGGRPSRTSSSESIVEPVGEILGASIASSPERKSSQEYLKIQREIAQNQTFPVIPVKESSDALQPQKRNAQEFEQENATNLPVYSVPVSTFYQKQNQVYPTECIDHNDHDKSSNTTNELDHSNQDLSSENARSNIQLRLSHMLDGYYLTSWKDMLIEMEIRDEDIKRKYKEENQSSNLIDQEVLYMEMDARLPRFSCNLNLSLSSLSNSSLSEMTRLLMIRFPALIDYFITAHEESRTGLSNFMKNYIEFMKTRPVFRNGTGREVVVVHQYASLVADFLIKSCDTERSFFKKLLDDMARANGMQVGTAKQEGHGRRSSANDAFEHILTQHSKFFLIPPTSPKLAVLSVIDQHQMDIVEENTTLLPIISVLPLSLSNQSMQEEIDTNTKTHKKVCSFNPELQHIENQHGQSEAVLQKWGDDANDEFAEIIPSKDAGNLC
jgi:hypothetical protein